jgi:hypothetical protein
MSATKPWPFHGDSPAARGRKVALAYRALAVELLNAAMKAGAEVDPDAIRATDERFMKWGEEWLDTGPVVYNPEDKVIARVAGSLIGVVGGTVGRYRQLGKIKGEWDQVNHCFRYKVADVYELKKQLPGRPRGNKHWKKPGATNRVSANGTGAPQ